MYMKICIGILCHEWLFDAVPCCLYNLISVGLHCSDDTKYNCPSGKLMIIISEMGPFFVLRPQCMLCILEYYPQIEH